MPTPIDDAKRPDLTPLVKASEALGSVLKPGDIVIYESTVYPGCTEEVCVPILERISGLRFDAAALALPPGEAALRKADWEEDLAVIGDASSLEPAAFDLLLERDRSTREPPIATTPSHSATAPSASTPATRQHRVTTILKVTSGSTPEIADFVDALYASIITAGTHKARSIKVAEAAKVIENTQRDLNIALINELAMIFNKLGIDTLDVLEAAGTKWNFLPFRPGLVGGHCIGVDPYYLTHKAAAVGYHPQVILAGRRINDGMGAYVADQVVKLMLRKGINPVQRARAGAGPGLQGKLPRPAQHPRGRHHRRSCATTTPASTCTTPGWMPPRPSTNTASPRSSNRSRAPTTPSSSPSATNSSATSAPTASAPSASPTAWSTTSNTSCPAMP